MKQLKGSSLLTFFAHGQTRNAKICIFGSASSYSTDLLCSHISFWPRGVTLVHAQCTDGSNLWDESEMKELSTTPRYQRTECSKRKRDAQRGLIRAGTPLTSLSVQTHSLCGSRGWLSPICSVADCSRGSNKAFVDQSFIKQLPLLHYKVTRMCVSRPPTWDVGADGKLPVSRDTDGGGAGSLHKLCSYIVIILVSIRIRRS